MIKYVIKILRKRYNIKIINLKKEIDYLTLKLDYYLNYYNNKLYESKKENESSEKIKKLEDKKESHLKRLKKSNDKKINKYKLKINKYINKIENIDKKNFEISDSFDDLEIFENDNIHLEVKNLSMHFGGLKAVDDLSFTVKKGEIFGIIGPNGAGKTTLFNCITQFYDPTNGKVYFNNKFKEIVSLNTYETHHIIDLGLARTFQNIELIWELNVIENLLVGSHSKYTSNIFTHLFRLRKLKIEEELIKAKAYEILQKLGIEKYAYSYPLGLPYGILKKIELARSLMTDPNLIILDEPAAGLNDKETEELAEIIKEIRDEFNVTILLVEHDMGLVMNISDTVCAISFGKKLAIGTPSEIQNNELVKNAYLGGD